MMQYAFFISIHEMNKKKKYYICVQLILSKLFAKFYLTIDRLRI